MSDPRFAMRGERINILARNCFRVEDVLSGFEMPPDIGIENIVHRKPENNQEQDKYDYAASKY
jgi:hypothetical protein